MAATFEQSGPGAPVAESIRVDKLHPNVRLWQRIRAALAIVFAVIALIPVLWMGMTAFKSRADAVAAPPKVFFTPTLEGFVNLFTDRRELSVAQLAEARSRTDLGLADRVALAQGLEIT